MGKWAKNNFKEHVIVRILIVDDDSSLLELLQQILIRQRYIVETATDGEQALDKLFETPFDLIILDIMMPKIDGLTALEEMRKAGIEAPVLMLTAKGDMADKVKGLDLGADDYLAKPFSSDELLARVRALLRRTGGQCESALQVQDLVLDTVSRKITKGGKPVELTPREFSILEFLLHNKSRAVSRFSLAEHVNVMRGVIEYLFPSARHITEQGFTGRNNQSYLVIEQPFALFRCQLL